MITILWKLNVGEIHGVTPHPHTPCTRINTLVWAKSPFIPSPGGVEGVYPGQPCNE